MSKSIAGLKLHLTCAVGFRKWNSLPKMERVNITGGGTLYFRNIARNFCAN